MSTFLVAVSHEMLNARRNKSAHLLLFVFIGMVIAASVIGWITNSTVTNVYNKVLADGLTTAPNPFTGVSPLFYERNSVIYVLLIGALFAIILGVNATLRDRKSRTTDLILSRAVSSKQLLWGQLAGIGVVLATTLALSFLTSWVVISFIQGTPLGINDSIRIVALGALSWVFLIGFAATGMVSGLISKQETTAYLAPFLLWSVICFVMPQLGTAARPIALLNPVPMQQAQGSYFDAINTVTRPLSITENFKTVAGYLLRDQYSTGEIGASLLAVSLFTALMIVFLTLIPRTRLRNALND